MSKKSGGLLTLALGAVAGAAAVFFSEKKNRQLAKAEVTKVSKKVKAAAKNPKAFKAELKKESKQLAKKAVKTASKATNKVARTVAAKTTSKKIARRKK